MQMSRPGRCLLRAGYLVTTAVWIGAAATAAPITFSATVGDRSASATFDAVGSDLLITLTNTSTNDVLEPTRILTALFFDIVGGPLTLTPASAVVPAGSTVHFGPTDPGGVVGGEWEYGDASSLGPTAPPQNQRYGVGSAGFGVFGSGQLFPGSNLQGPINIDGLQYGITSAGDNMATGNAPVTGSQALIQNEVVFRLSGLPAGFDPSTPGLITNLFWQYGTSLDDGGVPEPSSLALFALVGLFLSRRR